jgi:hypothetical protein
MICLLFVACILFSYNLILSAIMLICPTEYKNNIDFLSTLVNTGILTPIFSLRPLFSWLCSLKLPNFSFKYPDLSEFKLILSSKYLSLFESKVKLLSKYLNLSESKLKSLLDYLSSFDFILEYMPLGPHLELFRSEPHFDHVGVSCQNNTTSSESPIFAFFMIGGNGPNGGKDNLGGKFPSGKTSFSGKGSGTPGVICIKIKLNVQLGSRV